MKQLDKKNADKISIIVPVYNVEKYLNRCINSLITQTYKNVEIILVDDGSQDSCPRICDDWEKKDKRIKVIHKQNGGLSDARNCGIKKATGNYIGFVDSDDYVESNYIEVLYGNIKKFNVRISAASYRFVYENGRKKIFTITSGTMDKQLALKALFYEDSFGNYIWNKMYDINLFKDIKFPVGKTMEDLATLYLLLEKCPTIYCDSQIVYNYIQRDNSILHSSSQNTVKDNLEFTIKRFEYLQKQNIYFVEMYKHLISTCLGTYTYLYDDNYYAQICQKYLSKKSNFKYIFKLSLKDISRFLIFKLSTRLYIKLFKNQL